MGNKSSFELTLSFLLIASLCSQASIIRIYRYYPQGKMNWIEARQYCQRNHIDLITGNKAQGFSLAKELKEFNIEEVWIGLLRDPANDTAWRWINVKSGEGISGNDVSQSSNWAIRQQSSHCAIVADEFKWYSLRCLSKRNFFCSQENKIKHHKMLLTWFHASQYCQSNNTGELATITNADHLKKTGWIGLYREAGETWKWIGDQPSDYRNWAPKEPITYDCASFNLGTKKWFGRMCSTELHFVCHDDNLVVVNENKTWEDALSHCRSMKTPCVSQRPCKYKHDLLSLELSDYSYVRDRIYRATTDEVWTSLHFLGGKWCWVNGEMLEDQGMLPDCPSQWRHCGTLSKHDTNNWIIRDCSERRNFICYRKLFWIV
ncbi:hypothetical protein ABVT39_025667 [Epinephelus coioides]